MSREYVLEPFRPEIRLHIDYARELNPQQLAAVTAPPGPSLVIAGAGSGKTRTLTYRVAYLLEQGIPPDRILLLTFTNKAAREMMRRVADLLGQELAALWGGTFHSVGNRVLRRHAALLGYQPNFTILDREDARHLISACVAESDIDTQATRFPKADVLADAFSLAVNMCRTIGQIISSHYPYFANLARQIADVEQRYSSRKRAGNAMDFDDLLSLWLKLLREHPDVLEHYQRRFQFILVDEYQDTNKLQSDLIDLLAERHHNLMVVGDDAQSIYAWRGANFENILKFPRRFPETKVYKIETNYRSTPEILQLANAAIAPNERQFAKVLTPSRRSGIRPAIVACQDSAQQAAFVAQRALELREEGANLNQMAVLYRSHFHALDLQLELTRRNIPFSITSGIRFFEQAHVKDLTAYLKLVVNPLDELSFKRLVQLLPGVGGKGAEKLWTRFVQGMDPSKTQPQGSEGRSQKSEVRGQNSEGGSQRSEPSGEQVEPQATDIRPPSSALRSPSSVLRSPSSGVRPLASAFQSCAAAVPKKTTAAWAQLTATMAQLEAEDVRSDAGAMIRLALEASYEDYLKEHYANYESRREDLEQLSVFAGQFESVDEFLTQLALLTNLEAEDATPGTEDDERIRLSTIHQAKGLEFDVVFVIMLCDGLFPSQRSLKSRRDDEDETAAEEERRLFYVAVTRAKNELYLSYPLIHGAPGGGDLLQKPSRFIDGLPRELVEEWNLRLY